MLNDKYERLINALERSCRELVGELGSVFSAEQNGLITVVASQHFEIMQQELCETLFTRVCATLLIEIPTDVIVERRQIGEDNDQEILTAQRAEVTRVLQHRLYGHSGNDPLAGLTVRAENGVARRPSSAAIHPVELRRQA
jgi:hypothetical protein